jgi:ABC-type polysaccharide/polyol phosphate export permease
MFADAAVQPQQLGAFDRRYWYLIGQFAVKDFKIRYSHSVLGYVWSVLNPLLFTVIYYVVFSIFIRFEVLNYPGYLLLGIVLWNFFAEGTSHGATSLLARGGVVTKIAMPRQLVVYAAVLNASMTFAINIVVLGVVLWFTGTPLSLPMLTFPLVVLQLVMLTLGVSLFLAPLHVRFHDVGHLWGVLLQIGFWLTPIIYVDTMVPERWRWVVVELNPMARILSHAREALIWGTWTSPHIILVTTLFSATVLLGGWLVFQRVQTRVVEYY